jgi:HEPN domain-containing protein
MREEAKLWLDDAQYDLESAQIMLKAERSNYAVWMARQAVEKALKAAYLIVLKKAYPKSHNLMELARELGWAIPKSININLQFLNPHYTMTRYVDAAIGKPSDIYDNDIAEEAILKSKETIDWININLKTL